MQYEIILEKDLIICKFDNDFDLSKKEKIEQFIREKTGFSKVLILNDTFDFVDQEDKIKYEQADTMFINEDKDNYYFSIFVHNIVKNELSVKCKKVCKSNSNEIENVMKAYKKCNAVIKKIYYDQAKSIHMKEHGMEIQACQMNKYSLNSGKFIFENWLHKRATQVFDGTGFVYKELFENKTEMELFEGRALEEYKQGFYIMAFCDNDLRMLMDNE